MPYGNQLFTHWLKILPGRRRWLPRKTKTMKKLDPAWPYLYIFSAQTPTEADKVILATVCVAQTRPEASAAESITIPLQTKRVKTAPSLEISARLFYHTFGRDFCIHICLNELIFGVKRSLFRNNCSQPARFENTLTVFLQLPNNLLPRSHMPSVQYVIAKVCLRVQVW